jgi:hypothetical protein
MVQWLERSDVDADEDASALWGNYKTLYALKDLEKWLDEKQKQKQETKFDRKGRRRRLSNFAIRRERGVMMVMVMVLVPLPLLKNPTRSQYVIENSEYLSIF